MQETTKIIVVNLIVKPVKIKLTQESVYLVILVYNMMTKIIVVIKTVNHA